MKTLLAAALIIVSATVSASAAADPDHEKVRSDIQRFLNDLDRDDLKGNQKAILSLDRYITERKESARKNATINGVTDDGVVWKETVEHLVDRAKLLEPRDREPQALKIREHIIDILAADANDLKGREYLMHVLDAGPNNLRMKIIWAMRAPNGLHGADATKKVKELCDTGALPERLRGMALASASQGHPDDALYFLATTQDKMGFINAAMAYQMTYRSPEHFDILVRRIKELKLDEPVDKYPNGVFWVDPKLLAKFLDIAKDEALRNTLEVMGMSVALIPWQTENLQPVIRALSNSDPVVRQLAARRLSEITDDYRVDYELIIKSLAVAAQKETDDKTKTGLNRALDQAKSDRARLAKSRDQWSSGATKQK